MAAGIKFSDAIEEFISSRKAQGKAPSTVKQDGYNLRRLLVDTGNIYVANLHHAHIDKHFGSHPEWGVAHRSGKIRSFRVFFAWATRRKYFRGYDPLGEYKAGRRQSNEDKLRLPRDRFGELLDAAPHPRDRVFLALGLYLFLRPGETVLLKVGDVHLDQGDITVDVPKTHDQDLMPITIDLDVELRRWLTFYTAECGLPQPHWYLVPSKTGALRAPVTGGRFSPDNVISEGRLRPEIPMSAPGRVARRALANLGLYAPGEGGHTLRRSGARAYFDYLVDEKGYDGALRQVSAMLHHSSTTTTEWYLGLTLDRHKRNSQLKGRWMYGEPEVNNVIKLHSTNG